MSVDRRIVLLACAASLFLNSPIGSQEPDYEVLTRLKAHIPPLSNSPGDRLPLLIWQTPDLPMGIDNNSVSTTQAVYLDRGMLPLCNNCGSPAMAKEYLPIFQYWKSKNVPICILPQGWLQAPFAGPANRLRMEHKAPAVQAPDFECAAAMLEIARETKHSGEIMETLAFLKKSEIPLKLLLVDFESGLYLRNQFEEKAHVAQAAVETSQCPRCVGEFGQATPLTAAPFSRIADRTRASITRSILTDPARTIYPDLQIGNYFAWPINRLPPVKDHFPAYGYEGSGLNVAMPRRYMNAGWGGADRNQDRVNWNAFFFCLIEFSPAALVRRADERLIPWTHIYLGGKYLQFAQEGRALPEPWTMAEMARHMLLRGAETFAIYFEDPIGEFPANYPSPKYAKMGQLAYDVAGIQIGYNDMLPYNDFLRNAKAMTFEVTGRPNELNADTACWSGMITSERALVRTTSFDTGGPVMKTIHAFGRSYSLTFGPRGKSWWLYPDGRITEISR